MSRRDVPSRTLNDYIANHRASFIEDVQENLPNEPPEKVARFVDNTLHCAYGIVCQTSPEIKDPYVLSEETRKLSVHTFFGSREQMVRDYHHMLSNSGELNEMPMLVTAEQESKRKFSAIMEMIRLPRFRWQHQLRIALRDVADTEIGNFLQDYIDCTLNRMEQERPVLERDFNDEETEQTALSDAGEHVKNRLNDIFSLSSDELAGFYRRCMEPPENLHE